MKWKTFTQVFFLITLIAASIYFILLRIKPINRFDFKECSFDVIAGERTFSRKALIKMDKATGQAWELEQATGLAGQFQSNWEPIQNTSLEKVSK